MKTQIILSSFLFLLLFFVFACNEKSTEPYSTYSYSWQLKSDSMNFAVLVLDYETYTLEGGHFANYEIFNKDESNLPFDIYVQEPLDFGGITFMYTQTNDTLFTATVVWRGVGSITYPSYFLPADTFKIISNTVPKPDFLEIFEYFLDSDIDKLELKGDTVWSAIANLDIVNDFSQENFKAGIFLYPSSVGGFDPKSTKWIVFLCR
jgi:hypothetical protein